MHTDDISTGQHVTVLRWYDEEPELPPGPFDIKRIRRDGMGIPMRVLAVSLPYVLVEVPGSARRVHAVDTRRLELAVASKAYAEAFEAALRDAGSKSSNAIAAAYSKAALGGGQLGTPE